MQFQGCRYDRSVDDLSMGIYQATCDLLHTCGANVPRDSRTQDQYIDAESSSITRRAF